MKLRFVQTAALLIWGLQSDLIWFAIPMAIVWEAQFFFNFRWALTQQDFYRVADLTSVALVGILLFLFLNRSEYHFIITLVRWFPILFYPLVIVIGYSTTERMSLDVLFVSLRRQRQPVTQSWDLDYILFATCLVAAGTNMYGISYYFPLASLLICLALMPLRSPRYSRNLWILLVSITFLAAFATQNGIRGTHLELKRRAQVWIANWIQQRTNPLKTQTAIGSVGRLKLSDEILFRVEAKEGVKVPGLLQEASYDFPSDNSWSVMNLTFDPVEHADDFRWELSKPDMNDNLLDIFLEFKRERSLVPLPPGATEIRDLPALNIGQNYYGALQGIGLVPSPKYRVRFQYKDNINGNPLTTDTIVPENHQKVFSELISREGLDPDHPIDSVYGFFKDFRYSLYQNDSMENDPISHFLLNTKKGHCEYFASASVLLLRQLGVPARYVVGYAVQEYSSLLDMFIVRQRHAHAWAIAFVDGKWQVVDTTPAIWADEEAAQSNFLRPIFDLLTNTNFVFQVWWNKQRLEDYEIHLYVIGLILAVILAWRIMTSEQVTITNKEEEDQSEESIGAGANSPFLNLESLLQEAGYKRGPGELLTPWLSRIGYSHLIRLLTIHNQWRFDPEGISQEQKQQLSDDVDDEMSQITQELESGSEGQPTT